MFDPSCEKNSALLQPATAGHARLVLSKQLEQIYTSLYLFSIHACTRNRAMFTPRCASWCLNSNDESMRCALSRGRMYFTGRSNWKWKYCTVWMGWMSHRKWKETKQQPSMLPGPAVPGCCLVSFHFLCCILYSRSVWMLERCHIKN